MLCSNGFDFSGGNNLYKITGSWSSGHYHPSGTQEVGGGSDGEGVKGQGAPAQGGNSEGRTGQTTSQSKTRGAVVQSSNLGWDKLPNSWRSATSVLLLLLPLSPRQEKKKEKWEGREEAMVKGREGRRERGRKWKADTTLFGLDRSRGQYDVTELDQDSFFTFIMLPPHPNPLTPLPPFVEDCVFYFKNSQTFCWTQVLFVQVFSLVRGPGLSPVLTKTWYSPNFVLCGSVRTTSGLRRRRAEIKHQW